MQPIQDNHETLLWRLSGHISAADKAASDYKLLPFDVPPGLGRLTVTYGYSQRVSAALPAGSGNVIDIGCFDPRGAEFLQGEGFRGWSGSARQTFTVAVHEATPGYLPGPILPGTWHILLGLYRIQPEGCDYRIEIRGSREPAPTMPALSFPPLPLSLVPGPSTPHWYRGDLQSHTHHSDATGSLADLAAAARRQGLDFVAVTEHNTVSHLPHLAAAGGPDLLLIPGQEITTYYGHANAWGLRGLQEFRCRDAATMARIIDAVHAAGVLFSVNHPKDNGPPWEYGPDLPFDCVEAWQGPWAQGNQQSLAFWDGVLRRGRWAVAVGGSDSHVPAPGRPRVSPDLGSPTTWVYANELTTAGILAGIRAGHVFVSADPCGPQVILQADADGDGRYEVMMGDEVVVPGGETLSLQARVVGGRDLVLRIVSGEGVSVRPVEGQDFTHRWRVRPVGDTFYRVEVVEPGWPHAPMRALSNPVYVRGKNSTHSPSKSKRKDMSCTPAPVSAVRRLSPLPG